MPTFTPKKKLQVLLVLCLIGFAAVMVGAISAGMYPPIVRTIALLFGCVLTFMLVGYYVFRDMI